MSANFKAISVAVLLITAAIPTSVYAEPQFTIQEAAAANPNLTKAIHEMNAALKDLEGLHDDFGGNRSRAVADLRSAIDSAKMALNFSMRINEDKLDGAIINNK